MVGETLPEAQSVSFAFFVNTGARDEQPQESGLSHFLEHMMFKGTDSRDALTLTYALGDLGCQANAYTSEEHTVYYSSQLPERAPQALELFADMLRPALDPVEYDMERKVILEEISLYRDRPFFVLFEQAMQDFFGEHPLGNSVLGSEESIAQSTPEVMRGYHDRRYTASNITLSAAGPMAQAELVQLAEKYCGGWASEPKPGRDRRIPDQSTHESTFRSPGLQQSHLLWLLPGPSSQEEMRYAGAVLGTILGDNHASRLYWALVEPGFVENVNFDVDTKDGAGVLSVHATFLPTMRDQVEQILETVVIDPEDISPDEIERAKLKMKSRLVMESELPLSRAMAHGSEWLYREELFDIRKEMIGLDAVDESSIKELLERYPLRSWSKYVLLPE